MAEDEQPQAPDEVVALGGDSDAESTGSANDAVGADSERTDKATDDAPTPGEETDVGPTIASDTANGLYGLGELTLHFPARDVTLIVDGLAAAIAMDAFARRQRSSVPAFRVGQSSMRNSYFAFDLREALAVSWWPGISRPLERPIIDPVAPERV